MTEDVSMDTLQFDDRFCGPPGTGNGGYVAGRLAAFFAADAAVEVTLRRPVPLGRTLEVSPAADGLALRAEDGTTLVEVRSVTPASAEAPSSPGRAAATEASKHFAGFASHSFPHCFVCGPARAVGDGLRIFPGPLTEGTATCAAPWMPDVSLADGGGKIRPEFLWAALDCPGASAVGGATLARPMLLGRITGRLFRHLCVGEAATVQAWRTGQEGRKQFAGSAVYGEDGRLCGMATATWFEVAPRISDPAGSIQEVGQRDADS
jgi:hypothetical protein